MDILDTLRADGSIVVNKKLAKEIGLNPAVVLSELIARYKWHKDENMIDGEWFYCTEETLEEQTSLNRYHQDKAINELQELGLIEKEVKGMPAKRYFKINEASVCKIVTNKDENNSQTSTGDSHKQEKSEKQESKVDRGSKTGHNNTNNNTDKDNTDKNTYIEPRRNDSVAMDIYLDMFERETTHTHTAVEEQVYYEVAGKLNKLHNTLGEADYIDLLEEYFNDFTYGKGRLPKLQYFNTVADRFTDHL